MQEFAVVLIWDTMSDEGDVPVLVKIKANSASEALEKGIKAANNGTLYCTVFNEDSEGDEEFMEIWEEKSFAVPIDKLVSLDCP